MTQTASIKKSKIISGFLKVAFFAVLFFHAPDIFAQENQPKPFEVLPDDKPLASSSRFVVIDDFNTGKFTVRQGATWRIKQPAIGALDLSVDKIDGRSPIRGHSLKAVFNLSKKEQVFFETFLDRLDVSKADAFVFKGKLETPKKEPFRGRVRVTLVDWKHQKVSQDVTASFPDAGTGWSEIVLPISLFKTLDRDQLITLRFSIISQDDPVRGTLWLDEISFFGMENLSFQSHRDNLSGFPSQMLSEIRRKKLKGERNDKKLLKAIAADTWEFFKNSKDTQTRLIVDHIRVGEAPLIGDYTSTTNMAMDFLAIVSAMDLGFIAREEAVNRVKENLQTMARMTRYDGFFYNFYDTKKLSVQREYISTVDSGWLAISLVVIRQAFPELHAEVTKYLDAFDFGEFLDPENNQLVVGFDVPARNFGMYHYGMLVTEARATSFYAIGKGDVPRDHWWFLYRTLPEVWEWQKQKPKGTFKVAEGVEYFSGYYEKGDKKFVPSWGGSLFEVLMPTLVLKERELAPNGLGLNNRIMTELQRDYALVEKKYPVWGISPAADSNGRTWQYLELGVPELGAKGYPDREVITPHVSFLALDSLPKDAIQNIRKLLDYPIYGDYGFYDAINLKNNRVNPQYLALDQGMILVAICNYLSGGAIQNRFHADPVGKKAESLLSKETFFNS